MADRERMLILSWWKCSGDVCGAPNATWTLPGAQKNYSKRNNRNTMLNITVWGDIDWVFPRKRFADNLTAWKISRAKYDGTLLSEIPIAGWGMRAGPGAGGTPPFWARAVHWNWNMAGFSIREERSAEWWGNIWLSDISTGVWWTNIAR